MPDRDNKLGKAKNLGLLGSSPLSKGDRVSLTDLDDLYRFKLDERSRVDLSLSKIAKGAKVDLELYALKGLLSAKIGKIDFRKLRGKDKNILQLVSAPGWGDLAAGEYFVRVRHRKGSSRYELKMNATVLPVEKIDVDTVAPTATFNTDSPSIDSEHIYFTVTYGDDLAIDLTSLDGSDIVVVGPNGFSQSAVPVAPNVGGDGTHRTVKYKLTKSEGIWNNSDNGTYDIFLQGNEVKDTSGNFVAAGKLGSLDLSKDPQPGSSPEQTQSSDLCYVSGRPHGGYIRVVIDFSKKVGLGGGAVASGIEERPPESELFLERPAITFQSGDLYLIGIDNGQIKYQAKLSSGDGWYLYVQFLIRADVSASITDPTSLSSLKAAMAIPGAVAMGAQRTQEDLTLSLSLDIRLSYGFSSNYLMTASEQSYTLDENPSGVGNITIDSVVYPGETYSPKEFGVVGNELNNTITGNSDQNFLQGAGGNDLIQGEAGSDTLKGGDGNDTLKGGEGDDYLYGEAGNNLLEGGAGDDYYIVDNYQDVIVELPNSGRDTVYVSISGVTLAAEVENLTLSSDTNSTAIDGFGNELNNTIYGNALNNRIYGNAGNDKLYGGKGNDQLYGGSGDDTLYGDQRPYGDDRDAGNDLLSGGEGNDFLSGNRGNDQLYGGSDNDTLNGETGDDFLSGDDGNDRLNGSHNGTHDPNVSEYDTLIGGGGADSFIVGGFWGVSYIEAGDGYAIIQDWNYLQDRIETSGNASQYALEFKNVVGIGSSALDTEIYYTAGGSRERIAIIQDTTNVIISFDFDFV